MLLTNCRYSSKAARRTRYLADRTLPMLGLALTQHSVYFIHTTYPDTKNSEYFTYNQYLYISYRSQNKQLLSHYVYPTDYCKGGNVSLNSSSTEFVFPRVNISTTTASYFFAGTPKLGCLFLTLWSWSWTFTVQHTIYVQCEYFMNQEG